MLVRFDPVAEVVVHELGGPLCPADGLATIRGQMSIVMIISCSSSISSSPLARSKLTAFVVVWRVGLAFFVVLQASFPRRGEGLLMGRR